MAMGRSNMNRPRSASTQSANQTPINNLQLPRRLIRLETV
jgi:hypothetical protein